MFSTFSLNRMPLLTMMLLSVLSAVPAASGIQSGTPRPQNAQTKKKESQGKKAESADQCDTVQSAAGLVACPAIVQAGIPTDVSWSGSDYEKLHTQVKSIQSLQVFEVPPNGGTATVTDKIKVAAASHTAPVNVFRISVNVSADAAAGTYELYFDNQPTSARFVVTQKGSATSAATAALQVQPAISIPGQTLDVKISGGNYGALTKEKNDENLEASDYHFYWLIANKVTDCTVDLEIENITSDDNSVTLRISVPPDALPGKYQLYRSTSQAISKTATIQNSCGAKSALDLTFTVGTTALGEYTYCPLTPFVDVDVDLLCSQSVLTYKEERDVFGKAVADAYLSVEIKIQNRNNDFPFLLSDVRLGRSTAMLTTSRDRTFVRTFAEKGETYSARAIGLRAFDAASAVLGGIGPAVGEKSLSNAIQIIQGPTGSALRGLFPDRSIQEMGFISDNGFSVVQTTVIPARAPIRIFCFVPQRMLLDEKLSDFSDDVSPWPDPSAKKEVEGLRKQLKKDESNNKYDAVKDDLQKLQQYESPIYSTTFQRLQNSMIVEIAGMHVTQVTTSPSLTSITPDSDENATSNSQKVNLKGTAFDQIRYIQLGESTSNRFPIDPSVGSTTSATSTIELTAFQSTKADSDASKNSPEKNVVYLITTNGKSIPTSGTFTTNAKSQPATKPTAGSPDNDPDAKPSPTDDKKKRGAVGAGGSDGDAPTHAAPPHQATSSPKTAKGSEPK
jgi:hypothetical protein